jgi:DNA repair exonuclease SbcCD nuclease subunit
MNTRPTPETDAAINPSININRLFKTSQKLERERDEAREALAVEIKHHMETTTKWNSDHMSLTIALCNLNQAKSERDEAQDQANDMREKWLANAASIWARNCMKQ